MKIPKPSLKTFLGWKGLIVVLTTVFAVEFFVFHSHYYDHLFLVTCEKNPYEHCTEELVAFYDKNIDDPKFFTPPKRAILLSNVLLVRRLDEKAFTLLAAVAERHPDDMMLKYRIAINLFNLGHSYTAAWERSRRLFEAILDSGEFAATSVAPRWAEKIAEVALPLRNLTTERPQRWEIFRFLGIMAYRDGSYGEATAFLQNAIDGGADDSETAEMLAWCFFHDERFEEAIAALDTAVAAKGDDDRSILFTHAFFLLKAGRLADATAMQKKLIDIDPDNRWVFDPLINILVREKQYSDAIDLINLQLRHHFDDWRLRKRLAHLYFLNGAFDESMRVYQELLEQAALNPGLIPIDELPFLFEQMSAIFEADEPEGEIGRL